MGSLEFNEKWKKHLPEGWYGLDLDNERVNEYLDNKFKELEESYPNFEYYQIKLKSGYPRVYLSTDVPQQEAWKIEEEIAKLTENDK